MTEIKSVLIRVSVDDVRALKETATRLDLRMSEVVRRALRVGLREFERVEIPGGRLDREGRGD